MGSVRTGVMLAYPAEEKRLKKLPKEIFFQRKLNGERARVTWIKNKPIILSSCGNEMPFFKELKKELISAKLHNKEPDGELYCHGKSREEIHSICSRRVNPHPDENSLALHTFDLVIPGLAQRFRLMELEKAIPNSATFIKKVEALYEPKENLIPITEQFIAEGYEGTILRHPGAIYTPRKCNFMLKFKPSEEDIYPIIGYQEEVDKHGFLKGRLGSVLVKDSDGHIFSVGTGNALDDIGRAHWWERRKELVGMLAHVKHSSILTVNGFPTCTSLISILIERPRV